MIAVDVSLDEEMYAIMQFLNFPMGNFSIEGLLAALPELCQLYSDPLVH